MVIAALDWLGTGRLEGAVVEGWSERLGQTFGSSRQCGFVSESPPRASVDFSQPSTAEACAARPQRADYARSNFRAGPNRGSRVNTAVVNAIAEPNKQ